MARKTVRLRLVPTVALLASISLCFPAVAQTPPKPVEPAKPSSEPAVTPSPAVDETVCVLMKTSQGEIVLELNRTKAPLSVENFLKYANKGYYDGTVFHRVIRDFMIQGGGMTKDLQPKTTNAPVKNEADNGLKNTLGMVSMARTSAPDSATSQFFVNTKDNAFLDHRGKTPSGWGYAVFGKVVSGLDVVRKIEAVEIGSKGGMQDVPKTPVVIESVKVQK